MAMKIYTKTGDAGKTSLIGGTKVFKSNPRIEAYGTVDELNSHIGLVSDYCNDEAAKIILKEIQDRLFTIGSELACDPKKNTKMPIPDLHESDVELLEKEMDRMDTKLPPMKNFILPGGSPSVSFIHVARCVCRRAERCCVALMESGAEINPLIIKYINRLSDYLFMLARYTGMKNKALEIIWKPRL
ncbi:MAG TPA: cob(I)yrinic acid a,c-diamide adenosyltransferase [Hanamia sp.]|nr:cob(I)yrinic acid a,c-diamide adenosyltransferase [Hanamia sp.]